VPQLMQARFGIILVLGAGSPTNERYWTPSQLHDVFSFINF
jgi:hypothetical protein